MNIPIKFKTDNLWIIVVADEYRHNPNQATPLCMVVTDFNDDEYALNCHLRKIGMNGYSKMYARYFGGTEKLEKTVKTLIVYEFIEKYPTIVRSINN